MLSRRGECTRDPTYYFGRLSHDDVIEWKHFPRYWPFVRGIHRSLVNSPHKGQWRGALMFSLICVWINRWVNNRKAGDLRRYRAHYDVIVMICNLNWFFETRHDVYKAVNIVRSNTFESHNNHSETYYIRGQRLLYVLIQIAVPVILTILTWG